MTNPRPDRYHVVARALHWGMALLIFCLAGVGLYMTGLAEDDPNIGLVYTLHKSFGSLLLMLLVVRLAWRFISPPPPPPAAFTLMEIRLAKSVMGLLYILMFAIPVSGYLASTWGGYGVSFFGLFQFPALCEADPDKAKLAAEAHEILSYILLGLVVVHVAGALKHRLKGTPETDVLQRML